MAFKPIIQTCKSNVELSWLGRLGLKGIFDGYHCFDIKQLDEHYCEFIQSETFTGILVPFLRNKLNTETRQGFYLMNEALKKRCELYL